MLLNWLLACEYVAVAGAGAGLVGWADPIHLALYLSESRPQKEHRMNNSGSCISVPHRDTVDTRAVSRFVNNRATACGQGSLSYTVRCTNREWRQMIVSGHCLSQSFDCLTQDLAALGLRS